MNYWTQEQDAVLDQCYHAFPAAEIAVMVGRSMRSVKSRAARIGLTERPGAAWSADDIAFLMANAGRMSYRLIGEKLGRTRHACERKAHRLGIKVGQEVMRRLRRR